MIQALEMIALHACVHLVDLGVDSTRACVQARLVTRAISCDVQFSWLVAIVANYYVPLVQSALGRPMARAVRCVVRRGVALTTCPWPCTVEPDRK